jgi:hypothetical protein
MIRGGRKSLDKRFQHKARESISIESSSKSLRALRALCGKKQRFLIAQVEAHIHHEVHEDHEGGKRETVRVSNRLFG